MSSVKALIRNFRSNSLVVQCNGFNVNKASTDASRLVGMHSATALFTVVAEADIQADHAKTS